MVLAAVTKNGEAFYHAADALKADREVVLAAVAQDWRALENASPELKGDRDVVLAAVNQNGRVLENASAELKGDREVVLAAVKQNGMALKYASAELKGDRDFVLAAAKQNRTALAHASDELKRLLRNEKVPTVSAIEFTTWSKLQKGGEANARSTVFTFLLCLERIHLAHNQAQENKQQLPLNQQRFPLPILPKELWFLVLQLMNPNEKFAHISEHDANRMLF